MPDAIAVRPSAPRVFRSYLREGGAWSEPRAMVVWLLGMPLMAVVLDRPGMLLAPYFFALMMAFIGFIFAAQLWVIVPDSRSYFFAAPVGRITNACMRILSGWIWCMAYAGVFLLTVPVRRFILGHQASPGSRLASLAADVPSWMWLVPLGAATITYLLSSIMVVGTRKPQLWSFPLMFAVMTGPVFSGMVRVEVPVIGALFGSGPYGLTQALTAGWQIGSRATTPSDPGAWLTALALWLGIGVAGVLLASARYREW